MHSSFEVVASTNVDLALLEVLTDEELPSLEVTAPRAGEAVLALGYPDKHGVNAAGHLVSGQAYGGPVIDARGHAIGILNVVSATPDADGVFYAYEAASSEVWTRALPPAAQR